MNKFVKFLMLAVVSVSLEQANAAGIRLGTPGYGGTGCPAGSAAVTLSPGEDAISILFDRYTVEAGYTTGRSIDRKSCNIAVPVYVPQGYSVAIFSIDYRGYIGLPANASASLEAEYFWAGVRGPRFVRTGSGPYNGDYTVSDNVTATSLVWSPCGQSINLRVNTSLSAQTNSRMEQTMATVDSADISSGLIYHIQWRQCY
jgi:hypothetical protein